MCREVLAALLLAGAAWGNCYNATSQREFVRPEQGIDEDLAQFLTFTAPLDQSLQAYGAGDSNAATFSGGAITGAGALYYYPNALGVYVNVPSGTPNLVSGAYAAMGALNNQLLLSCGFTAASWSSAKLNLATNGAVAVPDGTSATYFVICEDNQTGNHWYYQQYVKTSAKSQAVSIYAKAAGRTWLRLRLGDGLSGATDRYYDLGTGALGSNVISGSTTHWWESSASITAVGGGWYRCVMVTGTPTGTDGWLFVNICSGNAIASYAGDNSSSLFIWGASCADNMTFQAPGVLVNQGVVSSRSADAGPKYAVAGNFSDAAGSLFVSRFSSLVDYGYAFGGSNAPNILGAKSGAYDGIQSYDGATRAYGKAISVALGTVIRSAMVAWGAGTFSAGTAANGFGTAATYDGSFALNDLSVTFPGYEAMGIVRGVYLFAAKLSAADLARLP